MEEWYAGAFGCLDWKLRFRMYLMNCEKSETSFCRKINSEKIENNQAEIQYILSKRYGIGTAIATLLLAILGFLIGASGGDDQSGMMGATLLVLGVVTSGMLFCNHRKMNRNNSNLKVFLKKQIRICKAIFSVFVTCIAIAALSNIDASSMGFLTALSTVAMVVGPLYFKANTALDYAEEQVL